jgi:hypothetical protein
VPLGAACDPVHSRIMETALSGRRSSPSVQRNRDPILDILREVLPASGTVLEIASGTGEHVQHFAASLPGLEWQPTDPSAEARASIAAWREAQPLRNVAAPLALDAGRPDWPIARADAVVAINMVHISPWTATLGLLEGAAKVLPDGGILFLYGPYAREGQPLAPSNAVFDADLRARDAAWGIRSLETVVREADARGLVFVRAIEMPANNMSVLFRKSLTVTSP